MQVIEKEGMPTPVPVFLKKGDLVVVGRDNTYGIVMGVTGERIRVCYLTTGVDWNCYYGDVDKVTCVLEVSN